jgi:hypothetical protein
MNQINQKDMDQPVVDESAVSEWRDPVIEAYKKDVDRTLLRQNLKLTVEERIRKAESLHASIAGWREAGRRQAAK